MQCRGFDRKVAKLFLAINPPPADHSWQSRRITSTLALKNLPKSGGPTCSFSTGISHQGRVLNSAPQLAPCARLVDRRYGHLKISPAASEEHNPNGDCRRVKGGSNKWKKTRQKSQSNICAYQGLTTSSHPKYVAAHQTFPNAS